MRYYAFGFPYTDETILDAYRGVFDTPEDAMILGDDPAEILVISDTGELVLYATSSYDLFSDDSSYFMVMSWELADGETIPCWQEQMYPHVNINNPSFGVMLHREPVKIWAGWREATPQELANSPFTHN